MGIFHHSHRALDPLLAQAGALPLAAPVSVVVACYGQLAYTQGLVESLKAHAGCEYELILVDNGCPEGTADWAEAEGLRCVRMGRNAGVPAAYNAGVAASTGAYVALFNNDMTVYPDGLLRLAQASELRGLAAQTGGCWGLDGRYAGGTADRAFADYAEGYALVFPRAVWDKVGEWDESLFPSYGDDADFCLRARLAGYDFTLLPGCVEHFGQATSGSMELSAVIREHQQLIEARYLRYGLGQRVLVERWAAVGDLIMATPVLRALKAAQPLARLHVHCDAGAGSVLDHLPYVDARTDTTPAHSRYSRVIDLIGAYELPQRSGDWTHPALAYARKADVAFDGQPYDLHVPERLQRWAADLLPDGAGLVACGIRSGTRNKQNWRASGWKELADALPESQRLVIIDNAPRPSLTGREPVGAGDVAFYQHRKVIDLSGVSPTIQHAAALIQRCEVFVGVDSGLLHVAHALGKPTVLLCAAVPSEARLPLVGENAAFTGKAPCFPCQHLTPCPKESHCLDWVDGAAVAAKLWDLRKACD